MRTFLISAALVAAMAAATPAAAQFRGSGYGQGPTRSQQIERQIEQLAERIRRAEDRDLINNREENRLLRQVATIDQRYDRFRRNGLTGYEQQELRSRIAQLRQRLQFERREGRAENRSDRWGGRRHRN
jgi:hypothetical protein